MKLKYLFETVDYKQLKYLKDTNNNIDNIKLSGWVKTYRKQMDLIFMSINDGSCHKNIQVIFVTLIMPCK